jgi:glycosyltransferase involved in cell wall biosynthesis
MKILIVTHEYYPKGSGIANLVFEIRKNLEKKGNTVKICSPYGPDFKVGSEKLIHYMGGIGILFYWRNVSKFLNKLNEHFDVIWLHNPLLTKKVNKKNIIITTHTTFKGCYVSYIKNIKDIKRKIYYKIIIPIEKYSYCKVMKNFRKTVTSKETINELHNLNVKDKKIEVIPNGVNFLKDTNKMIISKKIRIIYVGRFDYQKNLINMLRIFKLALEEKKNLILDMIGDGDQKETVERFIKKNNIQNVRIIGKLSFEKVLEEYNKHDYIILASYYEGFPMTLVEGVSRGNIPILSNIGIFKEVVKDLGYGINLDFEDITSKDRLIKYIESNNKDMLNIKREIIEKSSRIYNWDVISDRYIEVFKSVR